MENNNCILITKKEYEELKAKANENCPQIEIVATLITSCFSSPTFKMAPMASFSPSTRLKNFITKVGDKFEKRMEKHIQEAFQEYRNEIQEEFEKRYRTEIERRDDKIHFLMNRSWLGRLFNVCD